MSTFQMTPRVLKEAQNQAKLLSTRISTAWQQNRLKGWEDIEKIFSIQVPDSFKLLPWTYNSILTFKTYWINNVEMRLKVVTESQAARQPRLVIAKKGTTFGSFTLYAEQEAVFRAIHDNFTRGTIKAALQDGYTGSGKMIMGAAVIAELVKNGLLDTPEAKFRLHPIIVFTPNGVAEAWRRTLEEFGLGKLVAQRKICVLNDSVFPFTEGRMFVQQIEDLSTGEETLVWNPIMSPIFGLLDESHRYVNRKTYRTQCIEALILQKLTKWLLFMSATPMEKVNDSYLFCLATGAELLGTKVTPDTFKFFAGLLDSEPDKPNREAMKRLRSVISPFIFSVPYVKPKHKAINMVWMVGFRCDAHREIYSSAHKRYIDACIKAGKNTMFGAFEKRIALQNYRKTVEPLRADDLADRVAANYKSGLRATACGCAFKETIVNIAFRLVDNYNIPRDSISIIWGGKKEYKPADLLSREELDRVLKAPDIRKLIVNDKVLRKKIRITLRYLQDQDEHSETVEQQASRHNRLRELKLVGKQSDNQRQIEIDKYQSGASTICLFTNASGGIGLSLDCNKPTLLPREGLFTPVYSGKEFQQVLGRLVRRASIADAEQYICMMRDTVEEFHVAPILDEKLKCIAEITNRNFDIIDLLARDNVSSHVNVREKDEAYTDAEQDNTIVSDFVSQVEENEEDDSEELDEILT